jgi:exopolysaccharide production protein ExoQ
VSRPQPRILATSWVALGALALCVASEYKFRTRAVDETVNGKVDPFIVLELGIYALVALFLFWSMRRPPRLRAAPFVQTTRWIYTLVLAASATYAVYPALGAARAGELLVSAALAQAVQSHASSRQLRLMANAFVALVGASVLVGLVHRFPQPPEQRHRFTWLYLHPITAANYCGLAIVFCAALWLRNMRLNRVRRAGCPGWSGAGYLVLFVLVAGALFSTHTRTAIAATAVALLVYALLMTRVFRKRLELLVVLMLSGLVALVAVGPQLYAYISRGESGSQLATLNQRTQLWSQAFSELARDPLFGHGIGSSHGLFLSTAGLGGAHTAAIKILTDAGVIGCVAWAVFLGAALYAEVRLLKVARGPMEAPLLLALFAFFVINSITTEGLGAAANVQQLMLFLTSAWAVILTREKAMGARGASQRLTRVLALHPVGDRYGSDKVFVNNVLAMRRSGLDVSVMIAEGGPLEADLAQHGIPCSRLHAPVLRKRLLHPLAFLRLALVTPSTLLSLVRAFRRAQADLIYVNTATLPHCVVAARMSGIPVVCHVHELESSISRALSRSVTAPLLFATGLIANSRATAAHLRRDWRPLAGRTTVVYNGTEGPAEQPVPARTLRKIGVVGRLSPRKGQDIAVDAVSELLHRDLDIELVLIGDCFPGYEWYESYLRQAADEHPSRIRLTGYRSDVWQVYRDLDLVVVPSRLEPFGLVAVEAALSGRAVIAARVGGLTEIVRDGVTGVLVEPDDPPALAEAIKSLVAEPARAESFAREAALDASLRFSLTQADDRLLVVLRRCLGTGV